MVDKVGCEDVEPVELKLNLHSNFCQSTDYYLIKFSSQPILLTVKEFEKQLKRQKNLLKYNKSLKDLMQ